MNRPRKKNRELPKRMVLSHGAYYFLQPIGVRKNRWLPLGKDYAEALKKYADLLADTPRHQGSMANVILRWKLEELPRYAPKTRAEYGRMTEQIALAFQEFEVDEVRPKDVADFVRQWKSKPNMANKYKALLSLLFGFAISVLGLRQDNPCREVRGLKERKRDRYITDEELAAIRAGALTGSDGVANRSGDMIVCLIDLAYLTAQRVSDVLKARWDDVSEDGASPGLFFHPGKTVNSTGVKLLVSMTPDLKAILDRAKAFGDKKGETIIHGLDGRRYTYSGAHSAWRRACLRANVKNAHFHDLRAKALTDAKAQGLDAQKLAGHATEGMTAHYTKARTVEVVLPLVRKY